MRKTLFSVKLLAAAAMIAAAPGAMAQTSVTALYDNDEWGRTDREYTSGAELAVMNRDWGQAGWAQTAAKILPGIGAGKDLSAGWALGVDLYTPEAISNVGPVRRQRPYAGWLHGSAILQGETPRRLDTWRLDAGVIGPSAQGENLVDFFHSAFNGMKTRGWDNQIEDRLGLNATWERRWRNVIPLAGPVGVDVSPAVGVEAGTVSTAASAGVTMRLGTGLENDFGAPRVTWLGGSLTRRGGDGLSGYLFASVGGRYVAYDVFLDELGGSDGDAFRAGALISRDKWRTEGSLGAVVGYGPARLSLAFTEQSKLYDQQRESQKFGELTLGASF
jgi:lipid A 3-O-deacylase